MCLITSFRCIQKTRKIDWFNSLICGCCMNLSIAVMVNYIQVFSFVINHIAHDMVFSTTFLLRCSISMHTQKAHIQIHTCTTHTIPKCFFNANSNLHNYNCIELQYDCNLLIIRLQFKHIHSTYNQYCIVTRYVQFNNCGGI